MSVVATAADFPTPHMLGDLVGDLVINRSAETILSVLAMRSGPALTYPDQGLLGPRGAQHASRS